MKELTIKHTDNWLRCEIDGIVLNTPTYKNTLLEDGEEAAELFEVVEAIVNHYRKHSSQYKGQLAFTFGVENENS